jgi:hypothetical protein
MFRFQASLVCTPLPLANVPVVRIMSGEEPKDTGPGEGIQSKDDQGPDQSSGELPSGEWSVVGEEASPTIAGGTPTEDPEQEQEDHEAKRRRLAQAEHEDIGLGAQAEEQTYPT